MPKKPIFQPNEMTLKQVQPTWSPETLLAQKGVFYLNPVAKKLRIPTVRVKNHASRIIQEGGNPWVTIGVQRVWSHWMVSMEPFRDFLQHLTLEIRHIEPHWDANLFLAQKGVFFLVDACQVIPFTPNQIRYQAHRKRDSKAEIGVWKDDFRNAFLVENPTFATWIADLWQNGFAPKKDKSEDVVVHRK